MEFLSASCTDLLIEDETNRGDRLLCALALIVLCSFSAVVAYPNRSNLHQSLILVLIALKLSGKTFLNVLGEGNFFLHLKEPNPSCTRNVHVNILKAKVVVKFGVSVLKKWAT